MGASAPAAYGARNKEAGGDRIHEDTSQRVQYASTRAFYEHCGYQQESLLADFYAPDDGRVIYCKNLTRSRNSGVRNQERGGYPQLNLCIQPVTFGLIHLAPSGAGQALIS
jgi:hypothetical protein